MPICGIFGISGVHALLNLYRYMDPSGSFMVRSFSLESVAYLQYLGHYRSSQSQG